MVAPVRIGILLCDHVDESFREAAGGDYDEVFDRFFTGVDPTVQTVAYDAVNGRLPESSSECDAWLVTGSRHDAHADDEWILDLVEWIASAVRRGARVAGICFGHQLVARALGGRVDRAETWAVGPHRLEVEKTSWFSGGTVHLEAMHRDVVVELPPGARPIGRGTTARHPAFMVGDNVLGVQDHPEFTDAYVGELITARRSRIGDGIADTANRARQECPNDGPVVAEWITNFLLDRRL